MSKNAPYLFGGILTAGSLAVFSFISPFGNRFFSEKNFPVGNEIFLGAVQRKEGTQLQEGCTFLEYAAPQVGCDYTFDLGAAATYLISSTQGTEVAVLTNDRLNSIFPTGGVGIQPPESLSWAFKVHVGHKIEHGNWFLLSEYNYYKSISNSGYKTSYGQALAPSAYANQQIDSTPFHTTLFSSLEMGTYTLLNNVRLILCRPSLITPNLEFTTLFGMDSNFLQRRQISIFTNATTDTASVGFISSLGGYFQNYQKITWWGVGPSIGFKTRWNLGSNFYFLANANGALTYGNSTSRTATSIKRVASSGSGFINYTGLEAAVQSGMYQYAPSMRYLIGIDYEYLCFGEKTQVNFQIAYETAYYFNLMRSINPEGAYRAENGAGYGIQGLVLQAGVTF
jgi:hypothetical protein